MSVDCALDFVPARKLNRPSDFFSDVRETGGSSEA